MSKNIKKSIKSPVVGLTGGIGSGKSTVSGYFHDKYAVPVVDADKLSHALVAKGGEVLTAMVDAFGAAILLPDGNLNRRYVRGLIADDPDAKKQLEAIQYPILQKRILDDIADEQTTGAPFVIYDCPIFFKTHQERYVDRIMVVTCDTEERIRRIVARDDTTREMAEKMIAIQMSDADMARRADIVIDNSGDAGQLYRMLDGLFEKIKKV